MNSAMHHFNEYPLPGFGSSLQPDGSNPDSGHRAQLRERFVAAGPDAIADEEMLELILFRAIPRREVRSLARRLLGVFGDFNRVLSASPARLTQIVGVTESVVAELKIVEGAAQRMAKTAVMNREVLSCWKSLLNYCHTRMAHLETEQFRTLYLDRKNILIADEVAQNGTVDHVPVYPREIIKRALEVNASALILVHNHPSGDPAPSDEDITMTNTICQAADTMGLTVHDHLIIGKSGNFSFRSHDLI